MPNTVYEFGPIATVTAATVASPSMLPKFFAALAKTRTGVSNTRVMFIGDSGTCGYGAAGNGYVNAKAKGFPRQFANALMQMGLPAKADAWMGSNQVLVSVNSYDPRIVLSGSWAPSGYPSLGQQQLAATSSGSTISFTPSNVCDSVDIYYGAIGGNGSLNVNVDGGATITTVNTSATGGTIGKATVNFTAGLHTINLVTASGTFVSVNGMVAYLSTVPSINIINAGYDASRTSNWVDNTDWYYPYRSTVGVGADLFIVQLGVNDMNNGVLAATYTSNMTSLINNLKTVGDVLVIVPYSDGVSSSATQKTFATALRTVASATNVPVFDLSSRWGLFSQANGLGLMYDSLHPSTQGYNDEGGALANFLQPVMGPVGLGPVYFNGVLNGKNIPTSATGLNTGDVYNNGGVAMFK